MIEKLHKDEKGRKILVNSKTNTGYLIQDKDEKKYRLFSNRYILSVILFVLFANFVKNIFVSCVIVALFLIALEYTYRSKFLPSLTTFKNMKAIKKVSHIDLIVEQGNKNKCLYLSILYLILGILIVINGIISKVDLNIMIANTIISIGSIYFAYINFIAFTKIK